MTVIKKPFEARVFVVVSSDIFNHYAKISAASGEKLWGIWVVIDAQTNEIIQEKPNIPIMFVKTGQPDYKEPSLFGVSVHTDAPVSSALSSVSVTLQRDSASMAAVSTIPCSVHTTLNIAVVVPVDYGSGMDL